MSLGEGWDTTSGVTRRVVLSGVGAGMVGIGLPTLVGDGAAAAAATGVDPQQTFLRFVGGGRGQIFAIRADGALLWYRNTGHASASGGWASGSGRVIGSEWSQFVTVMGSLDGSLYALRSDGSLLYYRHVVSDWDTGAGSWVSYGRIGWGFDKFAHVFGFGGDIYGVTDTGDLYWYAYLWPTRAWARDGSGTKLAGNFRTFGTLDADTRGVVYGVRSGAIYWHRHLSGTWVTNTGHRVGTGFGAFTPNGLVFAGEGTIYGVAASDPAAAPTALLYSYRLVNYLSAGTDGRPTWANNGMGQRIGNGWTVEPMAALQGYALTRSVPQGEPASFAVSCTFPNFNWSVLRVDAGSDPALVVGPTTQAGGLQRLPLGFVSAGCGWQESVRFRPGTDWPSGLYAVRLEGPAGLRRHLPFVIRPATPTSDIAVILPTNTYHAYNSWGGHSQYTGLAFTKGVRPLSLNRPSREHAVSATGKLEHTLWSDVLLLRWLRGQGLAYDLYDDTDLHSTPTLLLKYKSVVLGSHPEYYTREMRQALLAYLAAGGHLVYTGGNAIYEEVVFDSSLQTMTFRKPDGTSNFFSEQGLPASQVLGVNYFPNSYLAFGRYRVEQASPLLAGTGLGPGSLFGADGYNQAACGWEVDGFLGLPGEADPSQVIAVSENVSDGCKMVHFPTGVRDGFVFSASSISFNGALATDPALSTLLRNVIDAALAGSPPQAQALPPGSPMADRMEAVEPAPAGPELPPIR